MNLSARTVFVYFQALMHHIVHRIISIYFEVCYKISIHVLLYRLFQLLMFSSIKKLSNTTKLGCGIAAAVLTHATAIEWLKHKRVEPVFSQGSADEMLGDQLNYGDIIMFSRNFYLHHLPVAALIKAQQTLSGCEFDHSGLIVMKSGVPYILERTPFGGIQCRTYEDCIRHSSAAHVVAIVTEKNLNISEKQKKLLTDFALKQEKEKNNIWEGEFIRFIGSLFTYIRDKYLNSTDLSGNYCANSELIMQAWASMGYQARPYDLDSTKKVTLNTIYNREIDFVSSEGEEQEEERDVVRLSLNDMMIRSS